MEKYKICPTCKLKNEISSFLCEQCLADLTMVKEYKKEQKKSLKLINREFKISIIIYDQDIFGRDFIGKNKITDFETISRKHAKFFLYNGEFAVEDLNSTNGSFFKGKKFKRIKLKNGMKISFSQSFEFEVEILN